tara:strand:+ start:70 stop:309 length:240 start_codon:yes stop_codon:yes gene_type:complete
MKVGDLVVLSAKGRKLKHNYMFYKGFGIVMEIYTRKEYYDFGIQWFCKGRTAHNRKSWFKRYEIKKLKPHKSQAVKKCP